MALLQGPFVRDVADVDVEKTVTIDIAEPHSHSLERIFTKDEGFRGRECANSFAKGEFRSTRFRPIVQQAIWAKIMSQIDFGKSIQVQVSCSGSQDPALATNSLQHIADVLKLWRGCRISGRRLPEKQFRSTSIFRFRFPGMHDGRHTGSVFVQDIGAILKEIADDQVEMSVAVDVGLRGSVRKPPLGVLSRFRCEQFLGFE